MGIKVDDISAKEPAKVVTVLECFTKILKDKFRVVIVSQNQARGLDFPSDEVIDLYGGVHVCITQIP